MKFNKILAKSELENNTNSSIIEESQRKSKSKRGDTYENVRHDRGIYKRAI